MLNIFQGGPQHNTIMETSDLVKPGPSGAWICTYRWTKETITGSVSGKIARVWRFIEEDVQTG